MLREVYRLVSYYFKLVFNSLFFLAVCCYTTVVITTKANSLPVEVQVESNRIPSSIRFESVVVVVVLLDTMLFNVVAVDGVSILLLRNQAIIVVLVSSANC